MWTVIAYPFFRWWYSSLPPFISGKFIQRVNWNVEAERDLRDPLQMFPKLVSLQNYPTLLGCSFFFFFFKLIPRTHLSEFGFSAVVSLFGFFPLFLPTNLSCDSDTTKSLFSPIVLLSPDALDSTRLLTLLPTLTFGAFPS